MSDTRHVWMFSGYNKADKVVIRKSLCGLDDPEKDYNWGSEGTEFDYEEHKTLEAICKACLDRYPLWDLASTDL